MVNLGPLDEKFCLGNESQFINGWNDTFSSALRYEVSILNRIKYIIETIYLEFGSKFEGSFEFFNYQDLHECYECGGYNEKMPSYEYLYQVFTDSSIYFIEYDLLAIKLLNAKIMIDNKVINIAE